MKIRLLALGFLLAAGIAACNTLCSIPGVSKLGLCSPTPTDTPIETPVTTLLPTPALMILPTPAPVKS